MGGSPALNFKFKRMRIVVTCQLSKFLASAKLLEYVGIIEYSKKVLGYLL